MMRALVITADPAEFRRWSTALADRGHQAEHAAPGADAVQRLASEAWPLIIVRALPDGAVQQLLQQIRHQRPHGHLFLLAVLDPAHARILQPLLRDGADDVLLGPLDPATMRARLLAAERRLGIAPVAPVAPATPAVATFAQVMPAFTPPALALDAVQPGTTPLPTTAATESPAVLQGILNDLNNAIAAASGSLETVVRCLPHDPMLARADAAEALMALRDVAQLAERLYLAGGGTARPAVSRMPETPLHADGRGGAASHDTILLIDDDARVRRPLRRALEVCGWAVQEAVDGDEGLALHQKLQADVRLVVVDMRMPRMSGLDVLRELRRRVPHLPVVLVSGHAADELHRPDGLTPDAFLRKPFELVDLARTVRRLLDRTPSAA